MVDNQLLTCSCCLQPASMKLVGHKDMLWVPDGQAGLEPAKIISLDEFGPDSCGVLVASASAMTDKVEELSEQVSELPTKGDMLDMMSGKIEKPEGMSNEQWLDYLNSVRKHIDAARKPLVETVNDEKKMAAFQKKVGIKMLKDPEMKLLIHFLLFSIL